MSEILTSKEAAKYLNISQRKLSSLKKEEKIRFIQIGRAIRYSTRDLDDFLNECARERKWSVIGNKQVAEQLGYDAKGKPIFACAVNGFHGDGSRALSFRCPICHELHTHGGGWKFSEGNGHRAAHANHIDYCLVEQKNSELAGDLSKDEIQ